MELDSRAYYEECWATGGVYTQVGHVPIDPAIHRLVEAFLWQDAYCLDVGCGDGQTAGTWLAGRTSHYVGVDISQNAVRRACERGLNATAIENASCLPFPDATFDLVLCTEVLEHLFQPQLAAMEIFRVLRPGAMIIATVPNVTHWWHRLCFCFAGRWDPYGDALSVEQPWRDPHIRFFTNKTLERMLRLVGFEKVWVSGGVPTIFRHVSWVRQNFDRIGSLPCVPTCISRRLLAVARKPLES
jgi:ubiquinone/menaquinone biosynthesis C-methylase UbiE